MSKFKLVVKDIAVLTDEEISAVSGGYEIDMYGNGTLGCSKPCVTTCTSENCDATNGCAPTSKDCKCP